MSGRDEALINCALDRQSTSDPATDATRIINVSYQPRLQGAAELAEGDLIPKLGCSAHLGLPIRAST